MRPEPTTTSPLPPIELRLHTASNVAAGGGVLGATAGRGTFYATRPKLLIATVTGGVGAFLKPWLALGLDIAETVWLGGSLQEDYTFIESHTFMPFIKFVSGMPSRSLGVFFEASPGILVARTVQQVGPLERERYFGGLILASWTGAHIPVGRSAAFLAGPTAGWVEDFSDFGDGGSGFVGFRFGMSAFVP